MEVDGLGAGVTVSNALNEIDSISNKKETVMPALKGSFNFFDLRPPRACTCIFKVLLLSPLDRTVENHPIHSSKTQ